MNVGVASSHDETGPRNAPHRAQTLSRTTIREVSDSQSRRDALFATASALRRAASPESVHTLIPDAELAALVDALADEHDLLNAPPVAFAVLFDTAYNRFLTALDSAVGAVRTCRQTAHSVNTCWFLTATTDCGDVLRCAHTHAN